MPDSERSGFIISICTSSNQTRAGSMRISSRLSVPPLHFIQTAPEKEDKESKDRRLRNIQGTAVLRVHLDLSFPQSQSNTDDDWGDWGNSNCAQSEHLLFGVKKKN